MIGCDFCCFVLWDSMEFGFVSLTVRYLAVVFRVVVSFWGAQLAAHRRWERRRQQAGTELR